MKRGDRVKIKMQKALRVGMKPEDKLHTCELLKYDYKKECLYLLVTSSKLTEFSLDAIYVCEIQNDTDILQCTGRIKERYCHEEGKLLKIEIENGFYKINIKSVDKQRA